MAKGYGKPGKKKKKASGGRAAILGLVETEWGSSGSDTAYTRSSDSNVPKYQKAAVKKGKEAPVPRPPRRP
tara:strand:+ start:57 stop:269 length:213 start_codon:yes stop_codon:yes gene_type:complete